MIQLLVSIEVETDSKVNKCLYLELVYLQFADYYPGGIIIDYVKLEHIDVSIYKILIDLLHSFWNMSDSETDQLIINIISLLLIISWINFNLVHPVNSEDHRYSNLTKSSKFPVGAPSCYYPKVSFIYFSYLDIFALDYIFMNFAYTYIELSWRYISQMTYS